MRRALPQRTLLDPAAGNDLAWVRRHLVDRSPASRTQARRPAPAQAASADEDEALMAAIQRDISEYQADKYRSELRRLKQKNRQAPLPALAKPPHDYQSKKRLATMTLLKNKVPQTAFRDEHLAPEQVYKLAAQQYKLRLLARLS